MRGVRLPAINVRGTIRQENTKFGHTNQQAAGDTD